MARPPSRAEAHGEGPVPQKPPLRLSTCLLASALLASAWLSHPFTAEAATTRSAAYARSALWRAVLRYCAVDLEATLNAKDDDAGFVTFEFKHAGKVTRGAFELYVPSRKQSTVVTLTLPQLPKYLEAMYLDRFFAKLEAQLGVPLKPRRDTPPSKDGDSEAPEKPEAKPDKG